MAKDRPPSFQFYPRDFLVDTFHLTDRQYRRYHVGLCRSWDSGGYGVGTVDEWRAWMGYRNEPEWLEDRDAILDLFMASGSLLVQKRMAVTRMEQELLYRAAVKGGLKSAARRLQGSTKTLPTLASASALKEESKHTRRLRPPREIEPEHFLDFYEAYPRRDGRRAAAKAFASALKRLPQYTAQNLVEGGREFAAKVVREGTEARFIPLPATWLNQERFREFFDEDHDDPPESPPPDPV